MGKQQPLRPIKFGERRSPAECKQLEGAGAEQCSDGENICEGRTCRLARTSDAG